MNNFELDRRAKELAASNSGYNLARRFLMLEDQLAEARREASSPEPIKSGVWQFYQSGEWRVGDNANNHRGNTEEAGLPTRDLYLAPPAPAAVPEGWSFTPVSDNGLIIRMPDGGGLCLSPEDKEIAIPRIVLRRLADDIMASSASADPQ